MIMCCVCVCLASGDDHRTLQGTEGSGCQETHTDGAHWQGRISTIPVEALHSFKYPSLSIYMVIQNVAANIRAVDVSCFTRIIRCSIASKITRVLLESNRSRCWLQSYFVAILLFCDFASLIYDLLFVPWFQNEAVVYKEPEKLIVSRSGEECVVALCDQWSVWLC